MSDKADFVAAESERVLSEYRRRHEQAGAHVYAPWQPGEMFMQAERKRVAGRMLHRSRVFPKSGDQCLEIGYGSLGWLGDLISWRVRETDLHGIELDASRARRAQEALPMADLRVGDATELPWDNDTFHLVMASTVFSSILDARVRRLIADEIKRVLKPGGALVWYDLRLNNPWNSNVRKVDRKEMRRLFPGLGGEVRSVTLAPPLSRFVASKSWLLANLLESIPLLRTHLLAVLVKPQ